MGTSSENDELRLQPSHVDPKRTDPGAVADDVLAQAKVHAELRELCQIEQEGQLLSFGEWQTQFGIWHLLLVTTFAAFLLAAYLQFGEVVGAHFAIFIVFAGAWIWLSHRERQRRAVTSQRIKKLVEQLTEKQLQGLDVNTLWHLSNRKLR